MPLLEPMVHERGGTVKSEESKGVPRNINPFIWEGRGTVNTYTPRASTHGDTEGLSRGNKTGTGGFCSGHLCQCLLGISILEMASVSGENDLNICGSHSIDGILSLYKDIADPTDLIPA